MDSLKKLYLSSYFLCVFKALKEDLVFKNFILLLKDIETEENIEKNIESFINFVYSLKNAGYDDFSTYLENMILAKKSFDDEEQVEKELKILYELSKIQYQNLKDVLIKKYSDCAELFDNLPYFLNLGIDIKTSDIKEESNKIDDIFKHNRAFIFDNDFEIKPLEISDKIRFSSLKGYSEQKKVLYDNTSAFLSGARVNNILLYGDAGCGKSSSVRALLNEFEEIRIIQIFKKNLINLDKLYLKLKDLPHKFIIFADDISFDDTDGVYSTMKAIIEGSLVECPDNVVLYATSNRRHLIRESFQSRSGDEVHLKDTINEVNSLAERFGINLFFEKPTNEEFNKIVLELAHDNSLKIDEKTLIEKAQRLALIKGTRSPRIAKQLIDNLIAHVDV